MSLAPRHITPVLRSARRALSRSCAGAEPPPGPGCTPTPRPPCRPRPVVERHHAVRVVCCAPSQGARPPCAPRASASPRTCSDRQSAVRSCAAPPSGVCGEGEDRVARRLAAAKAARRAEYEREAAARTPAVLDDVAPYFLGVDRECTRATDGRIYALPCPLKPRPRCGPGRTPPPPQHITFAHGDECQPSDGRIDPCAHRPRVFLEIDRSESTAHERPAEPHAVTASTPRGAEEAPPARSLTSRIMGGFGRARRPGSSCAPCQHDRKLHTSAYSLTEPSGAAAACGKSGGLAAALRARGALLEAGQGRVAAACASAARLAAAPPAGMLELPVPVGATCVTVRVALASAVAASSHPAPPASPCGSPDVAGKGSWLSMKSIQKRFSGCRGENSERRGPPAAPGRNDGVCAQLAARSPCGPHPLPANKQNQK